jgi:hypothetical protein
LALRAVSELVGSPEHLGDSAAGDAEGTAQNGSI